MRDRHRPLLQRLLQAPLGPGALPRQIRQALLHGEPPPIEAVTFVSKVQQAAHAVTDADITSLREAGFNDEQIFEMTVCVALCEGQRRLAVGLSSIGIEVDDAPRGGGERAPVAGKGQDGADAACQPHAGT